MLAMAVRNGHNNLFRAGPPEERFSAELP
jgi:hypothetical protein